jgi:hypothetical protein
LPFAVRDKKNQEAKPRNKGHKSQAGQPHALLLITSTKRQCIAPAGVPRPGG